MAFAGSASLGTEAESVCRVYWMAFAGSERICRPCMRCMLRRRCMRYAVYAVYAVCAVVGAFEPSGYGGISLTSLRSPKIEVWKKEKTWF